MQTTILLMLEKQEMAWESKLEDTIHLMEF
jgi:hypothetical protein